MSDFKTLWADLNKKNGQKTQSSSTSSTKSGGEFASLWNDLKSSSSIDENYIKNYYSNVDSYQKRAAQDYEQMNSYSADFFRRENESSVSDLIAQGNKIRNYIGSSGYDDATRSSILADLDEIEKTLTSNRGLFDEKANSFLSPATQDLYDQAVVEYVSPEQQAVLDYDVNEGRNKASQLEQELAKFEELEQFYSSYQNYVENGGDPNATDAETKNRLAEYEQYQKKYGSVRDLTDAIAAEYRMAGQSERAQKANEFTMSAIGNADFADKSGYVSTELDSAWEKLWSEGNAGYGDLTYEFINNTDGVRDNVRDTGSKEMWRLLEKMDPTEVAIYNYHYSTGGKEAADEYIESVRESLSARRAEDIYAGLDGKTGRELLYGVGAGLDQFSSGMEGVREAIKNKDKSRSYIPASATQITSSRVREDLADNRLFKGKTTGTSLGQGVYDAITTTSNMLPSILVSSAIGQVAPTLGGYVGATLMGASAGGNAYTEMLNAGYSKDQARAYGVLVGASEIVMEKAIGGITSLGGGALGETVLSYLDDIDNGLARFARGPGAQIIANAGSEALEEGVQSIIEPIIYEAISGEKKDVDWSEVVYSALLGAVTGGMFEGATVGINALGTANQGRQIVKTEGGQQALNTLTDQLKQNANEKTQKELQRLQDKAKSGKAGAVGNLYNAAKTLSSEQNAADITKALTEQGIGESTAKQMTDLIVGYMNGTLTKYGKETFDGIIKDKRVQTVVGELIDNELGTVGKRNQQLAATKKAEAKKIDIEKVKADQRKEFIKNNLEYKVSDDGRTFDTKTGKEVSVVDVKEIDKDGNVILNLDGGTTANAADLNLASEEIAMAYSALKGRQMSSANANALVKMSEGMDVQEFAKQVEIGYERGYANLAKPDGKVAESAYKAGMDQRASEGGTGKATPGKKGITVLRQDGSTISYEDAKNSGELTLKGKRSAAVETIEFLQKMELGTAFYLYRSYTETVDGKKKTYFKDGNGVRHEAPNGMYYKNGHIYIDLNAGASRNGRVMLYTVSHELTHHIQEWSAAKYKALADFLAEEYGKHGLDAYKQVKAKQQEMEKIRGKSVSFNEAYHEFVADSLSVMFNDGNLYDKLVKLHNKDADLFNEMKYFVDNLVRKVKKLFAGDLGETQEAKFVQLKFSTEAIERLQQMMAEALVDAGKNYNAAASGDYTGVDMTNEAAFEDSSVAVQNQIRPPYSDGSKAFNTFVDGLATEARKTFDLFYGFYQKSRITNTLSVTGRRVKGVNISSLYLLAQDWNDMLKREPKWASAAKELADFLPEDVRKRMNMNEDGSLNPTLLEKEFKMPSSMAQRLVDALPVENIDGTYRLGNKEITLPEGKARQSVGGEAYRRAIISETRKLFAEGKLKPVSIGTMSKDRWGSLGFLAANGKTGASGDFTTVCPQMMFNRGCWYCYRRAAMEKGVNNKLVAQSVWYTGEILRIKQSDIDALNKNGGLRIQSFGDWMPHFSAMLADVLYDAEQRGLQVKIITKEPSMINYIAALREQGIGKNLYFNLSADYTIEKGPAKQNLANGSLDTVNPERPFMRNDSGLWWKRAMTVEEAYKYREKYPWVNVRIVATTTDEFIRGLKDPRVDVVTGYHGNIREYERVDSTTGQHKVNVEALGDAGMPRFAFNPTTGKWVTEYEGKTSTHKRLAEAIAQNGLQMEYYTKTCCITGRCATCAGKCGALARDFNVKNATNRDAESVAYWQREMQYGIEPEFGDMTDVQFADRMSWAEKRMKREAQRDIDEAFAKAVDKELASPTFKSKSLLIGYTTELFKKLGIPDLPITFNLDHVYTTAKTKAEAVAENQDPDLHYHELGADGVKQIYKSLQEPVMIISPKDVAKDEMPLRSTHGIVAIVKVQGEKNDLLLPVKITVESRLNGLVAEVNELASAYHRDVTNLVEEAIAQEYIGQNSVFYITKEAKTLVDDGVQFPAQLLDALASNGIVHHADEKVNMAAKKNTQSLQFLKWFGDWQNTGSNKNKRVSVVVNEDGSPKVVYHGTGAYFTVFNRGDLGYHVGTREQAEDRIKGVVGGHVLSLYASIKNPLYAAFDFGDWNAQNVALMLIETEQFEDHPGRSTIEKRLSKISKMHSTEDANNSLRSYLKSLGYDGIAYENDFEGPNGEYSYIAFSPYQLKSASINVGTYDSGNMDFRYSDRIEEESSIPTNITEEMRQRGEKAVEAATTQREAKVAAEQKTHRAVRAALTNRDLIAQIEGRTELEKRKLAEYNDALVKSREYADKVNNLTKQIKDMEASDDAKKADKVKQLTIDLNKAKANKKTMESKLNRMENKELEPLVARERVRILDELRKEYGTIPAGKNRVRDDSLPTSTDGENFVSRTARTVKGAGAIPDEFADLIDTEVAKGGLTYIRITNDEATQRAVKEITKNGWEQALADWTAAVKAGKASAEMSAMGALLLNNAANAGDKKAWLDILHTYQQMGTNAAQAVQAMRILKTLAPSDKLYMAEKSVEALAEKIKTKNELTINEELKEKYINAKTNEERDAILDEIQQDLANQIPATLKDKWTALWYLNMLGNLRTQVRNLAGNTIMGLTVRVKDLIATGIEAIAYVSSGGKFERTKALLPGKELRKAASADYDFVADIIATGGKYNDANNANSAFIRGVMEKRKIFSAKLLEIYREKTNWAMDKGDVLFSRAAYASALAGYLKAHGVTETDFSKVNESLLEKARLYAVQEAQEATFHDINAVSEFLTRRYRGENKAGRVLSLMLEGIMPFRKTPANIVVRAWEYSPLGVTNALVMSAKAMSKNSDVTGAEIVNTWSKALTGSALFVAGMLLASSGHLIGGPDDDESKDKFQQLNGEQNYAIKIGNKYITIDWASPSAIPLFMGAQLYQLVQENGFQLKDIESALTSIADPLVEMSMLQGVNDTLDNIKYSDNKLMQLAINTIVSYTVIGFTNSALGQIERSIEKFRSTTYVDKNKDLPDWLQRALGKASAKIPGLDYNQIPYINAWGEEEENPGILQSLVYNMLSPSYITEDKTDAVSAELYRLDDVNTSGSGVFPSTPRKTATFTDKDGVKHKDYQLNAEEYVALAKKHGQTQRQIIEKMISNEMYQNLPDEYKVKAVQAAYDYARENAQIEVLGRDGYESKWMGEIKGDVAKGILDHIYSQNAKELYLAGEFSYGEASSVLANQRGKSKSETETAMSKWQCEKDTGIAYDDLKQAYISGEITADKAASYKAKYGGMRVDEAQKAVDEWKCEKETGIAYTDIKRAYLDGEITAGKAASLKVKYGDFDEDEAAETVAYWDFQADYPDYDDLSQNYAFAYLEEGKSAGIKIDTYYDCCKKLGKCEGEKDEETGKTKSGSVREEMNELIDSYPLTRDQKYVIYYASGGSEKKAHKVPWY